MADEPLNPDKDSRAVSVIFVHGILSSPDAWNPLIGLLSDDDLLQRAYVFTTFEYATPKVSLHPLKRIPTIKDVASKLDTWLQGNYHDSPRLVLVGHSQGGLVIQQYLSVLLQDGGRQSDLARVRAVILLATPNTGSELFMSLRRWIDRILPHPQEQQLRPYDEAIEDARRVVFERAVLAAVPSDRCYPIKFFVYAGETDGVVKARSAHWMFPNAGTLPGDHSSILQPPNRLDARYTVVVNALRWARHSFPADGQLVETKALDWTRPDEIDDVLRIMNERFRPDQDVRPEDLKHWLHGYQERWALRLSVLVGKVNGDILGFLMFHEGADLIIVDYIATRSGNVFSESLTQRMVEQLKNRSRTLGARIVFEVENPEVAVRRNEARARVRLFERFGARVIKGVDYLAPDMETMAPGSETSYLLMYLRAGEPPPTVSMDRVKFFVKQIYTQWYRNWFSHYPNAASHAAYLTQLCATVQESVSGPCQLDRYK